MKWRLLVMLGMCTAFTAGQVFANAQSEDDGDGRNPTDEEVAEMYKRGARLVELTGHGRFILAGEVVDQDANPLQDVAMLVSMDKLQNMGWTVKSEGRSETLTSGRFRIDVRPYAGVNLHFEKDGYYTEERDYDYKGGASAEVESKILAGKDVRVEEGVVRDEKIRVVMEKKLPYAKLTDYSGAMVNRITDYGPIAGTAIDFNRPVTHQKHLVSMGDLGDTNQWPQRGVMMEAELTPEGTIACVVKQNPGYADSVVPKRVQIRMLNPEDGFLPYEGTNWLRETEAPTEGYRQELDLDADTMWRVKDQGAGLRSYPVFYRVAGKYGKGRIALGSVSRDQRSVSVGVGVQIQSDGSRYIHTPVKR